MKTEGKVISAVVGVLGWFFARYPFPTGRFWSVAFGLFIAGICLLMFRLESHELLTPDREEYPEQLDLPTWEIIPVHGREEIAVHALRDE